MSSGYRDYIWDKLASLFCYICWSEDENLETDQNESVLSDIWSNFWVVSNEKRVQQEAFFMREKNNYELSKWVLDATVKKNNHRIIARATNVY